MSWWSAWERWLSGQPLAPHAELWGVQLLWWGRIGKIAEFAAALIVVLDLIGPDRLRQWGGQATARTRRASRRVGLARVEQRLDRYHNDLYDRLYDDLSLAYVKGWSPEWLRTQRSLGFDPVADERIGERRYWELVAELHDTTRAVCTCAEPHRRLCEAQREHIGGRVALLVEETAGPEEREALQLHGSGPLADVAALLQVMAPLVLLAAVLLWAASRVASVVPPEPPVWAWLALGLLYLVLTSETVRAILAAPVSIPLRRAVRSRHARNDRGEYRAWARAIVAWRRFVAQFRYGERPEWWPDARLGWQVIRGLPAFVLARPLAALLDKAQPGHVLRWIAFVVFLLGFHFDLLAS